MLKPCLPTEGREGLLVFVNTTTSERIRGKFLYTSSTARGSTSVFWDQNVRVAELLCHPTKLTLVF